MAGDSLLPSCFEVDVQGAQQLRLAHRAEQTEEGRPPDPRGLVRAGRRLLSRRSSSGS